MKKVNYIIQYIRETPNYSISKQMTEMKTFCDSRQWSPDLIAGFIDEGLDGNTDYYERSALSEVVDVIKKGGVDVLLVSKLDRLFRNQRKLNEFVEILEENNVALASATESSSTETQSGQLMIHMLDSFAEHERLMANKCNCGECCCCLSKANCHANSN